MSSMNHGTAADWGRDLAIAYKTRIGLLLFALYCLVYSGFVVINTIKPALMEVHVCCGVNLACIYGFGLIVFAIVLGLVYTALCTKAEDKLNKKGKGGTK